MAARLGSQPIDDPDDDPGARMGFLEHLDEFRTRLIRCCVAIGAGMAVSWFFLDRIINFVLQPALRALPPGGQLTLIRPGEGFSFSMNVALIGGVVFASPVVSYQVWKF